MENTHVWLIAKTSFVNRWTGSVNKKQRFLCPINIAQEFIGMGLAEYESADDSKKAAPSQEPAEGGMEQQSASLPAAPASPASNAKKSGGGAKKQTQKGESPASPASTEAAQ
jgi:hypothetical protein